MKSVKKVEGRGSKIEGSGGLFSQFKGGFSSIVRRLPLMPSAWADRGALRVTASSRLLPKCLVPHSLFPITDHRSPIPHIPSTLASLSARLFSSLRLSSSDPRLCPSCAAFTLVELLIVITIIVVLAALMAPMLTTAIRGTALNRGADQVIGVFSASRQSSIARAQTVEIRFYCYTDPENPAEKSANSSNYHALQAFVIDDSGNASPLFKAQALPQTVVLATNSYSGTNASSLLTLSNTNAPGQYAIPRVGTNYTCSSFRIYRSGLTSLIASGASSNWCVTVANAVDLLGSGATNLPTNYTTVVIDPYNATIRTYRPTL